MNTFSDYYAVLGVEAGASPETIKAAFKKLALQYHPDVYKGTDAHARMRQLLDAYQVLNDPVARREYDAQRSGHGTGTARPAFATSSRSGLAKDISPNARRDRNRYYAFPALQAGRSGRVDLKRFVYTLTPAEAGQLAGQGLLRGVAAEYEGQYYCHRCHHRWRESQSDTGKLPRYCPNCYADDWPEYLLLHCSHCKAVFESEQIRYEVGLVSYGGNSTTQAGGLCPPYELFPLCPYCGKSHWCPSEETRVEQLRQQAEQRAFVQRCVLIGVVILVVAGIGWLAVSGIAW